MMLSMGMGGLYGVMGLIMWESGRMIRGMGLDAFIIVMGKRFKMDCGLTEK